MVAMPIVWDERCRLARAGRGGLGRPRDARDGSAGPGGRAARGARRAPFRPSRTTTRCCSQAHDPGARRLPRVGVGVVERRRPPGRSRPAPRRPVRLRARGDPCAAGAPAAAWARPGYFAYDTMTLIGPGTWEAARGAVDAALTAVDLVTGGAPHRVRVAAARRDITSAVPPTEAPATSTTPRSRPRRCAATRAGSPCSTSTRTTATGRRRSSGTGTTCASRRSTSIRRRAGSRTSSASRTSRRLRTSTCRSAPGTGDEGWLAAVREAAEWLERRGARRLSRGRRGARAIPRARCG